MLHAACYKDPTPPATSQRPSVASGAIRRSTHTTDVLDGRDIVSYGRPDLHCHVLIRQYGQGL